jgi:hypothetical protein
MILRAHTWPTNAHLMADVAALGYVTGTVFDATYGLGNFWTEYRPDLLVTNDLYTPADFALDFTKTGFLDGMFSTVVFDPPYKLNGTPSEADVPYGVHFPTRWQDRMDLIARGTEECARITNTFLLVKCMDQVCSGAMRWQTDLVTEAANITKVDRFDFLSSPRPQPGTRRQVHAASNYSTLLVFAR